MAADIEVLGPPSQIPTGPRGVGIRSVVFTSGGFLLTYTDDSEAFVAMPLGDPSGSTGNSSDTDLTVIAQLRTYVAEQLVAVKAKDAEHDGALAEHTRVLTERELVDAQHGERLDAIAKSVADVVAAGATDAELATAIADLSIADYLTISAAAERYARLGHTHPQSEVVGLTETLDAIRAAVLSATGVDMTAYTTKAELDAALAQAAAADTATSDARYARLEHAHADLAPKTHTHTEYLTATSAAETYTTKAHAEATYAPKAGGSGSYLTTTGAAATYLAKSDAASTYATKAELTAAGGSGINLTKAEAASIYATKVDEGNRAIPRFEIFGQGGPVAIKSGGGRAYVFGFITRIHASVGTPSTSGPVVVNVVIDGVVTNTLSIPAGQHTAEEAGLETGVDNGQWIGVNVTSSGTGAADLVVRVRMI